MMITFVLGMLVGATIAAVLMAAVQIAAAHDAFLEVDEVTRRAKQQEAWWRDG